MVLRRGRAHDIEDSLTARLEALLSEQIERSGEIGGWYWPLKDESVYCSQSVCRIFQHHGQHAMPFSLFCDAYTRDSASDMHALLNNCRRGESFCRDFDLVGSHGTFKRLKITGNPVYNDSGDIKALVGCVEDISRAWFDYMRYQLAIDTAGIGVWEYNIMDDRLFWNDQMFRMYGRTPVEGLNLADWKAGVHPDDQPLAINALEAAIANDQLFATEFRVVQSASSVIHVKAMARTFYDDNHQPLKAIGVNIDITQLKNKERDLRMERAQSVKQAKLAAVGELAASIGHEINNPLAIAVGNIELLKEALMKRGVMDESLLAFFDKHEQSTHRVKHIVAGLRRLVRDESHEALTIFKIRELLENIVDLLVEIYKKQGITLQIGSMCEASVKGHFGELQQVVMNLLSNAKDAVSQSREKVITVSSRHLGEQVIVDVADTGIGIERDKLVRIFDSFYTNKPSGTGLGLNIAERIVREHSGTIDATSEPGKGAVLHVHLPFCQAPAAPTAKTNERSKKADAAVNIDTSQLSAVIVDDEPMILTVVKAYFESLGIRVFATTKVHLALKALATGDYKLLVTDMCMPEGDGLSLVRQVRNTPGSHLRCVLMTGGIVNDLTESEKKEIETLDGVIQKPFTREDVVNTLISLGEQHVS